MYVSTPKYTLKCISNNLVQIFQQLMHVAAKENATTPLLGYIQGIVFCPLVSLANKCLWQCSRVKNV
ncbi:hypothetical protein GBAR_LOCUS17477, partial [Geodia barretti]